MALPTPHDTQLRHRTRPRCLTSRHNTWGWYLQRGLLQVRTANVFGRWASHLTHRIVTVAHAATTRVLAGCGTHARKALPGDVEYV